MSHKFYKLISPMVAPKPPKAMFQPSGDTKCTNINSEYDPDRDITLSKLHRLKNNCKLSEQVAIGRRWLNGIGEYDVTFDSTDVYSCNNAGKNPCDNKKTGKNYLDTVLEDFIEKLEKGPDVVDDWDALLIAVYDMYLVCYVFAKKGWKTKREILQEAIKKFLDKCGEQPEAKKIKCNTCEKCQKKSKSLKNTTLKELYNTVYKLENPFKNVVEKTVEKTLIGLQYFYSNFWKKR